MRPANPANASVEPHTLGSDAAVAMGERAALQSIAVISTVHDTYDTRIFYKQIASLRRHYRVHYLSPCAGPPPEDWIVPLHHSRSKLGRLKTHLSLLARLPRIKADLYLLHDPELLPLGILLRCLGKRVVWDMHEDTYNDIKTKTYLAPLARALLSSTYRAVQWLGYRVLNGFILAEDKYADYFPAPRRTCVVHNYPLLDRLESQRGAPQQRDTIVYIGSISTNRGVYQLLDIVERLAKRIPEVRLVLIGPFTDEALEASVRRQVLERGLQDNVDIRGRIKNVEAYPLIAQCRVGVALLLPEPNFAKSLPTKMFEYMALGLPVVVSDFPLWKEIVERHDAGAAVDPLDVQAAADAIHVMLSEPSRYERLSANACAAARLYSWETESRTLLDFLGRILARRSIQSAA